MAASTEFAIRPKSSRALATGPVPELPQEVERGRGPDLVQSFLKHGQKPFLNPEELRVLPHGPAFGSNLLGHSFSLRVGGLPLKSTGLPGSRKRKPSLSE